MSLLFKSSGLGFRSKKVFFSFWLIFFTPRIRICGSAYFCESGPIKFGFMDLAHPTDPDPDPKHWLKLWVLLISTFSTHAYLARKKCIIFKWKTKINERFFHQISKVLWLCLTIRQMHIVSFNMLVHNLPGCYCVSLLHRG